MKIIDGLLLGTVRPQLVESGIDTFYVRGAIRPEDLLLGYELIKAEKFDYVNEWGETVTECLFKMRLN